MATKRKRGQSWEYIVKRKALLSKPLTFTFGDEAEGDTYVARLEALLDRGIVPQEFVDRGEEMSTVDDAIRQYLRAVSVTDTDAETLGVLCDRLGAVRLRSIDYPWVEAWVSQMKRDLGLAPSTIRRYVGALARCFDWCGRRGIAALAINPLRMLPKRYAQYMPEDAAAIEAVGGTAKADEFRDRRLLAEEEAAIRHILAGAKPQGRERPLTLHWQGALELLLDLALESAMRLSEMYTLTLDQIDLPRRTIFLDRTKNGAKRQVPLSSVALAAIDRYLAQVRAGERNMGGWDHDGDRLFPWWSGDQARPERKRVTALLSAEFARIAAAAGCADYRFHDLRHEATSRIYERTTLSDLQIAKITGHKSLASLQRYANLRASDLADRLW
ncbi:tyrosine-type recombinase/integrase [Chitiniphilus eburneus]|uniref:tyrosine-type recombinase/integrase n=1 Tax=Chitiniphilus eburneus TaxID=2571148 RepID=UPI0035CF49BC